MKSRHREIVEILDGYAPAKSANSVAGLAVADSKPVRRYVAARRERINGPCVGMIEGWVERSKGKVRADSNTLATRPHLSHRYTVTSNAGTLAAIFRDVGMNRDELHQLL